MIYLLIGIITAVLVAAAVVGCWKPEKNDDLCKYDRKDNEK